MPGMLKKAMLYLGLGSDEDFEDYDHQRTAEPMHDLDEPPRRGPSPQGNAGPGPSPRPRPVQPSRGGGGGGGGGAGATVRPVPMHAEPDVPVSSVVRPLPVPTNTKPHVVVPTSFNQAQEVADRFKDKQPVIVNLQQAERDLSRRLIDFTSGLCYGLGGKMEKVADQVYLLTPSDVHVSTDERRRLKDQGLITD